MTVSFALDFGGKVIRSAIVRERDYSLHYLLGTETERDGEADAERDAYCIHCAFIGDGVSCDSASVRDVTSLLSEAERIFELIVSGHVTPCTLTDTVGDIISGELT